MALIFALFCERIVTVRIGALVEFVTVLFDEDSLPLSLVRFFCFLGEEGVVGTVEVSSTLILLPSFFLLTIIVILFIGSKLVRLLGTLGSLLLLLLGFTRICIFSLNQRALLLFSLSLVILPFWFTEARVQVSVAL